MAVGKEETKKRGREQNLKITNSKSQITNKFQITMTKIPKINKKRITMIIMGHDINKHSTMFDRVSKVFAGSRGGFFKKSPWPPEAKLLRVVMIG